MPTWHLTNGLKRDSENNPRFSNKNKGRQNAGDLFVYKKILKNTLNVKFSITKVFNLNHFPYLCVQYLTIFKKKSQSVFHLTSEYNIGR